MGYNSCASKFGIIKVTSLYKHFISSGSCFIKTGCLRLHAGDQLGPVLETAHHVGEGDCGNKLDAGSVVLKVKSPVVWQFPLHWNKKYPLQCVVHFHFVFVMQTLLLFSLGQSPSLDQRWTLKLLLTSPTTTTRNFLNSTRHSRRLKLGIQLNQTKLNTNSKSKSEKKSFNIFFEKY